MISDPLFYLVAIPAVLISGISKGGMGGGLGVMSVPLMALVISPVTAAAIMLPILCVMDLFGLWGFRGIYDRKNLKVLLPAAILGVSLGALTFHSLSEAHLKFLIGVIATVFCLNWMVRHFGKFIVKKKEPTTAGGWFFGALSGFTSFSVHAGGPPINMYLLPQQMDKTVFVGTTVVFFTVVNYAKLIPYAWLGLFDLTNLSTSLGLMILAPIGIRMGMWMHHRVSDTIFYIVCYGFLLVTGLKLLYESLPGLL